MPHSAAVDLGSTRQRSCFRSITTHTFRHQWLRDRCRPVKARVGDSNYALTTCTRSLYSVDVSRPCAPKWDTAHFVICESFTSAEHSRVLVSARVLHTALLATPLPG